MSFTSHAAGKDDMQHVTITAQNQENEQGPIYVELEGCMATPSPYETTGSWNLTIETTDASQIQELENQHQTKSNRVSATTRQIGPGRPISQLELQGPCVW